MTPSDRGGVPPSDRGGHARERLAIEVRVVTNPEGALGVLLQFRDGWLVMTPYDARLIAGSLMMAVGEIERSQAEEG